MSMCIQHCWLYGSIMRGSRNFRQWGRGSEKTLITFLKLGSNIFQGRGSKFFHAFDRSTCFFSEANPKDRLSHAIARATIDTSKHNEVHNSGYFIWYRDIKWNKHALKRKFWEAEKCANLVHNTSCDLRFRGLY